MILKDQIISFFLFQGDIESEGLTKQKFKEEDLDLESMDHLDYEQYRLGFCDKIILSLFQIFPQEKNWPKKDQSVWFSSKLSGTVAIR